ncbi:hypothetical protein BGW80DRAFT_1444369 [Lactifluus volemus]|nr:hypothetical protein BGW80DRAFT_1444369 [Lactifluus volemus]
MSPDETFLAAGLLNNTIRVWDDTLGQLIERLRGHEDRVYSVAFTPNGLFLDAEYGLVNFWCYIHDGYVLCIAVSHDSWWVVSSPKDRGVQIGISLDHRPVIAVDLSPL